MWMEPPSRSLLTFLSHLPRHETYSIGRTLLPLRDYLTVQLVRLVASLGQQCAARQSRSWGKRRMTGRLRIDDVRVG
jgi:hypothetical protein